MQRAGGALRVILQANETSDRLARSGERLTPSELSQVEALMEQTKFAYPQQEIPPETAAMWAPAWIALALKYGIPAMRAALAEHMLGSRFFPQPAELRERIEANRPRPYTGFVPLTPTQVRRLTGRQDEHEMSFEECDRLYGREAARRYRAKVERGE